jgi:hypothetical protein
MKPRIDPDLLPILTETADGTVLDLPTLTETLDSELEAAAPSLPLTDEQCRQLAEQLFPRLEATLRDAIGSRSEARWAAAMQQVQARLPDLIRDATARA